MNCLILVLLLCCCGNNGGMHDDGCGCGCDSGKNCGNVSNNNPGVCRCPGRMEQKNECRPKCEPVREDSCRERGFTSFPSAGSTCGCEE